MEIEKALKANKSLEDISEKCDRFYLEASLIQTSMYSDELDGKIEKVVVGTIKLLYKTCLSLLTNANFISSDLKFVKGVSTRLSDNSKHHVFGLYSDTVAIEPVEAHVPPKVFGLKLLKNSKEKERNVAENPTV